jgi:transposase
MATIQARKSRGHTYWYIVESRRVNGKPRPVTLAYLGKPSDLLQRLKGEKQFVVKSYGHGDLRALLQVAEELQVVEAINQAVPTGPTGRKPMRDGLTVGGSVLMAALGRACQPTSKRGWHQWAKGTDVDYVLGINSRKLDCQHFWDQMDALPAKEIPNVEQRIVERLIQTYGIELDLLLLDYTNFFTFIDSDNKRNEIAQRGKNKQRRLDLRQIGLALLVSRKEQLPLFHCTYRGNKPDVVIFRDLLEDLRKRIASLTVQLQDLTLVLDKGNNSKANLHQLGESGIHYVGSLTPAHHKKLIEAANQHLSSVQVKREKIQAYRTQAEIWGSKKTLVVLISERLRQGQVRGIRQHARKQFRLLEELKRRLQPGGKSATRKLSRKQLADRISRILQGQHLPEVVSWKLERKSTEWQFDFSLDEQKLADLAQHQLGRRILMTDHHGWSTEEIILAYRKQTKVEYAFRNLKDPFHGAWRPSFHWTDQKLQVHSFICVLAYLMMMVLLLKAKRSGAYKGSVRRLMDELKSIRLAAMLEEKDGKRGRAKVQYALEQLPAGLDKLALALGITKESTRSPLRVGVYA